MAEFKLPELPETDIPFQQKTNDFKLPELDPVEFDRAPVKPVELAEGEKGMIVDEPTFGETFAAQMEDLNLLVNFWSEGQIFAAGFDDKEDPEWNVFDQDFAGYEEWQEDAFDIGNESQWSLWKSRRDEIKNARQVIDDSSWQANLGAGALAMVLDPTTFIPVWGAGAKALKAGEIAAGAAKTAATFGAIEAGREASLHAMQTERTIQESAINITGAVVLGGIIYGGTKAGKRWIDDKFAKELIDGGGDVMDSEVALGKLSDEAVQINSLEGDMIGGGSALVRETTLHDETMVGNWAITMMKHNPDARLLDAKSVVLRRTTQKIMEHGYTLNKNLKGIASPESLESRINVRESEMFELESQMKKLWQEYKQSVPSAEREFKTFADFDRVVAQLWDSGNSHPVSAVKRAAGKFRTYYKNILDELHDTRIFKIIDENLSNRAYFPHTYNQPKIKNLPGAFEDDLRIQVQRMLDDGTIEYPQFGEDIADYLNDITRDMRNNITGDAGGVKSPTILSSGNVKHFKGRKLVFDDEFKSKWLNPSALGVTQAYHRQVVPEIEFAKSFMGDTIEDVRKAIAEDYDSLVAAAKTEKAKVAIRKEQKLRMDDFEYVYNYVMKQGNHAHIPAGVRILKKAATLAYMGGVLLTSLAYDYVRLGIIQGVRGYLPVIQITIARLMSDSAIINMSRAEKTKMFGIIERAINKRARLFADLMGEEYYIKGKFETGLDSAVDGFYQLTGLKHHTGFIKDMAAMSIEDKVIRLGKRLVDGKKISEIQRAHFASMGLDENDLVMIYKEFETHGQIHSGSNIGNYDQWDNIATKNKYLSALMKEVDNTINTVQSGSRPKFISTAWGSLFAQFLSFGFTAAGQTTGRMIQLAGQGKGKGAAIVTTEMAALLMAGSFTYELKALIGGWETEEFGSAGYYKNAVDFSGMLAIPFAAWNKSEQAGITDPILSHLDIDRGARYRQGSKLQAFGASLGFLESAGGVAGSAIYADKDFTTRDLHQLRKGLPLQNMFYLKSGFDWLEEQAGETLNLPDK